MKVCLVNFEMCDAKGDKKNLGSSFDLPCARVSNNSKAFMICDEELPRFKEVKMLRSTEQL